MLSRLQIFLSALLLSLWMAGAGVVWAQASDYQKAVSLVQQGEFDLALPLLQQILDQSPNDLRARNLMGIALSAAGRREEANQQFEKALAIDQKFIPALKNLAVNELALGRTQDARLHFEEALKLAPQDATCHWGLAEIAFAARDFERAMTHYEQSGDLALKDPRVAISFASSYAEEKQADKSAAVLEKIPSDADANIQFQAALILAKLEKFEAAARRFELARKGFPDPYQVGFNLLLVRVKNRDYAEAIKIGEEMLVAGYRKAELYNLLARAYEKSGKTKEAYESLRAATELEPQDETNYLDLIALCLEQHNYELGLQISGIGVWRIPSSYRLHLQRGVVLAMKGRFEEAEKEFKTSGRLSPETGLSHVALGLVLIQMDKLPEAIDLLRHASARLPNDPHLLWLLGEALNRSGVTPESEAEKEVVEALEKSIQLDPNLSQSHALLGKILLRRGETDRAVRELEKALKLDPEDLFATYQLALALRKKGDTARAMQLFERVEKARSQEREFTQRNLQRIIRDKGSQ